MTTPTDDINKIAHGLAVRLLHLHAAGMYANGLSHEEVTAELQEMSGGHLTDFCSEIVTHGAEGREVARRWMGPPIKFTVEIVS